MPAAWASKATPFFERLGADMHAFSNDPEHLHPHGNHGQEQGDRGERQGFFGDRANHVVSPLRKNE